jgi:hypothetical protein
MLEFERIPSDSGPELLQKIRRYEAVHPVLSPEDLSRRVGARGPGRAIFGLFSRAIPGDPLAFVCVAFLPRIATSIQSVLSDPDTTEHATTAIFYSITKAQGGLKGIDLGQALIKRTLGEIQRTLPGVRTFSTLSPVPGFRRWFDHGGAELLGLEGEREGLNGSWWLDERERERMRPVLMKAAHYYLTHARKGGHALDPVGTYWPLLSSLSLSLSFASTDATDPSKQTSTSATARSCTPSTTSATLDQRKGSRRVTGLCVIIFIRLRGWRGSVSCCSDERVVEVVTDIWIDSYRVCGSWTGCGDREYEADDGGVVVFVESLC